MVSYLCGRQLEKKAVAGRRRLQEMDHGGGAGRTPTRNRARYLFSFSCRFGELSLRLGTVWTERRCGNRASKCGHLDGVGIVAHLRNILYNVCSECGCVKTLAGNAKGVDAAQLSEVWRQGSQIDTNLHLGMPDWEHAIACSQCRIAALETFIRQLFGTSLEMPNASSN
jgi:hypothetical protein